ncbi:MAG: hypothetical protein AAF212_07875 [Verrucomicrobiota bacterium]
MTVLIGCGTTQDHRRRQYSRGFQSLSRDEQSLASEGKVALGMPPLAVYIAMGAPLKNGNDMSMPVVPQQGMDRWHYRGTLEKRNESHEPNWIRFLSRFEGVVARPADVNYLVVEFTNGRVAKLWLMSREYEVLEIWR